MTKQHIEITKEEAKKEYCKGNNVYVSNEKRNFWKLPASYEYSSHESAESLFYRSLPEYEGKNTFYKMIWR